MKRLILAAAAAAVLLASGASAQNNPMDEIKTILLQLESDPSDYAQRRADVMRTALALGDQMKYNFGSKGECRLGVPNYDCSGYVSAVVRTTADMPSHLSSAGMYARAKTLRALGKGTPQPGDILFFQDTNDANVVGHTAIYVGSGRFVHMYGKNHPLTVSSLDDHANLKNRKPFTWRQHMTGFADLDVLPARAPGAFEAERVAAGGKLEVRVSPAEPGGVYISPELVYRALKTDRSGVLQSLENIILASHFDVEPVQEIEIEIPADFDR